MIISKANKPEKVGTQERSLQPSLLDSMLQIFKSFSLSLQLLFL